VDGISHHSPSQPCTTVHRYFRVIHLKNWRKFQGRSSDDVPGMTCQSPKQHIRNEICSTFVLSHVSFGDRSRKSPAKSVRASLYPCLKWRNRLLCVLHHSLQASPLPLHLQLLILPTFQERPRSPSQRSKGMSHEGSTPFLHQFGRSTCFLSPPILKSFQNTLG